MEQETKQLECPLLRMLQEDVTIAGDIIRYVVNHRQKKIDILMGQVDNGLDIDPEISGTVMELLEMYNLLAKSELESVDREMSLSIENGYLLLEKLKAYQSYIATIKKIEQRIQSGTIIPDEE